MALKRCEKDTCLQPEAETRRQIATLFCLSWKHGPQVTQIFVALLLLQMTENLLLQMTENNSKYGLLGYK